jgi:hypothetical protein
MEEKKDKNFPCPVCLMVVIIVIVAAAAVGAIFWWQKHSRQNGQVACTQEAMLCPDGSYVGRTGPNCEFAECPGEIDTSNWQTYLNGSANFEIKYPSTWTFTEEAFPPFGLSIYPNINSETGVRIEPSNIIQEKTIFDEINPVCQINNIIFAGRAAKECIWTNKIHTYIKSIRITDLKNLNWENSNVISISIGQQDQELEGVINQILSTFKFTK